MATVTYHRHTQSEDPMSDWGHAMFSEDYDQTEHYGHNHWTITPDNNQKNVIAAFDSEFVEAARKFYRDVIPEVVDDVAKCYGISIDEAIDRLIDDMNPDNIVDSAGFWDSEDISPFWEYVMEPNGWDTVITYDGCITFDPAMIQKA